MITNNYGTVILGSLDLLTSVAGEEIIPSSTRLINFQLDNDSACHISINGGDYIYIKASKGINIPVAHSCKIQENSITYTWVGQKG